jgi:hypothetical protein
MSCRIDADEIWPELASGQKFRTPDKRRGVDFQVASIAPEHMRIRTIGSTFVPIHRQAFENAIHYLKTSNHYSDNPCAIRSNNDRELAGPLCVASRDGNHNVRCINYILPILESFRIVGIDGKRPNKTWLVE